LAALERVLRAGLDLTLAAEQVAMNGPIHIRGSACSLISAYPRLARP
jgi:hypothetical protein